METINQRNEVPMPDDLSALIAEMRAWETAKVIISRAHLHQWADRLSALVIPSPAPQKADWQPIESAPKDGTVVLLYQPGGMWQSRLASRQEWTATGYFHKPANEEHPGFWVTGLGGTVRPTHFQPLPDPPSGSVRT